MLKMIKYTVFFFLLALIPSHGFSKSELYRYTLLKDKIDIDRELKRRSYNSYFNFELLLSSGTKSLVGDVKDGNRGSLSSTQKTTNMLNILNQNVNTTKFVDADISAAIPLPNFSLWKFSITPGLFYHLNFGLSFSISNQANATNPTISTYIKKDIKLGMDATFKNNPSETYLMRFYQLNRADLQSSLSAASMATKGKVFEFDDLKKEQITYNVDLGYQKNKGNYSYSFEIKELKLMAGTVQKVALYENRPFLHAQIKYPFYFPFLGHLFVGVHQRFKYSIVRGAYAALKFKFNDVMPFYLTTKVSSQFLTIMPQVISKYFNMSYTIKTPIENPQEDFWVATIHALELSVPFF